MKKVKALFFTFCIVAALVCTSFVSFAFPPGGGGTECPDRCNSDDVNCCTDPKGTLHCGRLP